MAVPRDRAANVDSVRDPAEHHEIRRDRVSVVLATFNGSRYVAEQLASLVEQTRQPDEVVVVDDASDDGTVALVEAFAERSPAPVRLVARSEHRGTWATFEEGLRRATGDVLVVCDQDDHWAPEKLEVLLRGLAERPDALMAFSDARLIDPHSRVIGRSRWRVAGFSPRNVQLVSLDPFGQLLSHQAVSGCTMAIRADLLPALLPFPADVHPGLPRMMYDRWMSLMAAAAGPVVTVPEKLVDYRIHPAQQSGIRAFRARRLAPRTALLAAQFVHRRAEVNRRLGYHAAHLEEIRKRLEAADLADGETLARLAAAQRHLRMRGALGAVRRRRIRVVSAEYRRLDGYRRFSLGLASALADIVR